MACSPDGVLATASFDGTIRLWDIYTGSALRTITVENYGGLLPIAFSPDGKVLASAGMALHLWDVATGRQLTRADVSGSPNCIAISPDGATLAVGSGWEDAKGQRYTRVELFDLSTGRKFQTLEGPSGIETAIAFAPDGRCLVSASEDGTLTLWTPRPWQQAFAFGERGQICVGLSFDPGTRPATTGPGESLSCAGRGTTVLLAAGFIDGRVQLWSLCQTGN